MKVKAEIDLLRARTDLGVFARMVGRPLTDWQLAALGLKTRMTVLVSGRQMGKSYSLAVLGVWWAFRKPGQRVMIISSGEEGARRLLREVRDIVMGSELLSGSVTDETASLVRLTNGSEIRSVPQSAKQIRGWANDLLLDDEVREQEDEIIEGAALPTISARPDARVVLASTPGSTLQAFYRYAMAGEDGRNEHVRTFTWKSRWVGGDIDAPWVTEEVIDHLRAILTSERFDREYRVKWGAGHDEMFPPELVRANAANIVLPDLARFGGKVEALLGVDWSGLASDRTVCAAITRLPVAHLNPRRRPVPVFVAWPLRVWSPDVLHSTVINEIAGAINGFHVFNSECNGAGAPSTPELFRTLGRSTSEGQLARVSTNAEGKATTYFWLKTLMEREQLVIPNDERLIRELVSLRVERRPSGSIGIEAASGHDDVTDAIYLAAGPRKRPSGWSCDLAWHAANGGPDAPLKPVEDVTRTGSGLVVATHPALQSIVGTEVAEAAQGRRPVAPAGAHSLINRARERLATEAT